MKEFIFSIVIFIVSILFYWAILDFIAEYIAKKVIKKLKEDDLLK